MTAKALAQLRRAYTEAQQHLAFLERCAVSVKAWGLTPTLMATPERMQEARAEVEHLERLLTDNTPQLPLFDMPESKGGHL